MNTIERSTLVLSELFPKTCEKMRCSFSLVTQGTCCPFSDLTLLLGWVAEGYRSHAAGTVLTSVEHLFSGAVADQLQDYQSLPKILEEFRKWKTCAISQTHFQLWITVSACARNHIVISRGVSFFLYSEHRLKVRVKPGSDLSCSVPSIYSFSLPLKACYIPQINWKRFTSSYELHALRHFEM